MYKLLFLLICLLLNACAETTTIRPIKPLSAQENVCTQFFTLLEHKIMENSVGDAGAANIAGFPYLRINRFLASYHNVVQETPQFNAWLDQLQTLGLYTYQLEIANLPLTTRAELQRLVSGQTLLSDALQVCARELRQLDFANPQTREYLVENAKVPSHYHTTARTVGLYPVTSSLVNHSINRWHQQVQESYAQPLSQLPVHGQLLRYVPSPHQAVLNSSEAGEVLTRSANNLLKIPEPNVTELEKLFTTFAPIWEIDVNGDFDLPGTLYRSNEPLPHINTARPTVYHYLSYTRFASKPLLQLNYVIWFSERPRNDNFDMLGGFLDGITWRVTLDSDGQPLLYDTMHNCGFYHMFFPSERLRLKAQSSDQETPLIPQTIPFLPEKNRLALRIASRSHDVQRIFSTPIPTGIIYQVENYDSLRSLPTPDGKHRSLFNDQGIVNGTERGERWVLWTTGVPEPGAMRQLGTHTTALIGQRHFDEVDLLDRLFERQL